MSQFMGLEGEEIKSKGCVPIMNKKPFWEESYKKGTIANTFANGKPSPEFYDLIEELPKGARVLDLGCGDGRNAILLAQNGFHVTAVDISIAAIKKLNRIANDKDISIITEIKDMRDYNFKISYDLIISHGCLHLIERKHWLCLIEKLKSHTHIGGYNVIAVFTDEIPPSQDLTDFSIGLFREGELYDFYKEWKILLQKSYILEDEHLGGTKHKHPINKLVAKK